MTKFFVNEFLDNVVNTTFKPGPNQHMIGLFKQCIVTSQRDPCLGCFLIYDDYYLDTELYAFYIANNTNRISNVVVLEMPINFHQIKIASHSWTCVIEAETVEEAIGLFGEKKWRRFDSQKDYLEDKK